MSEYMKCNIWPVVEMLLCLGDLSRHGVDDI